MELDLGQAAFLIRKEGMRRRPLGWAEAGHLQELKCLVPSCPQLQFKGMARRRLQTQADGFPPTLVPLTLHSAVSPQLLRDLTY